MIKDAIYYYNKPGIYRPNVGEYPPGSTFKLISAIAGLNENIITP